MPKKIVFLKIPLTSIRSNLLTAGVRFVNVSQIVMVQEFHRNCKITLSTDQVVFAHMPIEELNKLLKRAGIVVYEHIPADDGEGVFPDSMLNDDVPEGPDH